MEDGALESSSEEGSSLDEPSWVSWFCMLRNHEFFCEVDPAFVQDRFNLYGLKEVVGPLYGEAMTMILGYAPTGSSSPPRKRASARGASIHRPAPPATRCNCARPSRRGVHQEMQAIAREDSTLLRIERALSGAWRGGVHGRGALHPNDAHRPIGPARPGQPA